MTKKVFVSLPMRNRSVDEIREDMNSLLNEVRIMCAEVGEDVELIDTIWPDGPGTDIRDEGCWYLGRSIMALAQADLAIFHPGWREARGCIIEHMVCAIYNIPYFDISMDYGELDRIDDVNDYTHDWDFAGEINAELSDFVAKAEGLDDISQSRTDKDISHDDSGDDLDGEFSHDQYDETDIYSDAEVSRDDVDELVESDPDLNPYAQHSEIDIAIVDEFDDDGNVVGSYILEPGEYDADVR